MSRRVEHLRECEAAALHWGEVNADFGEASDRLARLLRVTAGHSPPSLPTTDTFRVFADQLYERASNARRDALDAGDMARSIRELIAEDAE